MEPSSSESVTNKPSDNLAGPKRIHGRYHMYGLRRCEEETEVLAGQPTISVITRETVGRGQFCRRIDDLVPQLFPKSP